MKYFGTDGIRGVVDRDIDGSFCYKVGLAIGQDIIDENLTKKVFIGMDTRISSDILGFSVACGLIDMGIDVYMLGVISTGGVSYLASTMDIGYAVMITASHNTSDMNGVKVITNLGYKASDTVISRIEANIDRKIKKVISKGHIFSGKEYVERYITALKSITSDLSKLSIVVDAGYGSMSEIAPRVLMDLHANVIPINCDIHRGLHINENCGAQYPNSLRDEVLLHHADYGIAFDGDADRLVVINSRGEILTGDDLIFIFALYLREIHKLNSMTIVGTIMTNSGVEMSLMPYNIKMIRTNVGDSRVIEKLNEQNLSLGGESSGHICMPSLNSTCDAFMNALMLLNIAKKVDINEYLVHFTRIPQVIESYPVSAKIRSYVISEEFTRKLDEIIGDKNVRCVVRPSGTENVVRIMVESSNYKLMYEVLGTIKSILNINSN